MRTETRKIYKFSELSEDAKQKAIEHYRDNNHEIHWADELLESFKAVYRTANVPLKDYELSLCSYSSVEIDLDSNIGKFTGARAIAWFENNLFSKLRISRAEFIQRRKDYVKYGRSYRYGHIKECPFTGYCADMDFIDCINTSLRNGDSLEDIFKRRLVECYVKQLQSEYDAQNEDDYIAEHMQANDYEFLESGEQY